MDLGNINNAIKSIEKICEKETKITVIDDPESRKALCQLTADQVWMNKGREQISKFWRSDRDN